MRSSLFGAGLFDGVDQQVQVVIKELEVVGDFLDAPDRWRHHHYFCAGLAADRIWRLQIEIGLNKHELDVGSLHLVDEIERVLRRRRDAGLRFDVSDNIETKPLSEIRE